jgi:hypothetical protein
MAGLDELEELVSFVDEPRASRLSVYVLAKHADCGVVEAIATHLVCFFILVGNFAYIWRSRQHVHIEKGANASHALTPHG